MTSREGVLLRGDSAQRATPYRDASREPHHQSTPVQRPEQVVERRTTIRRAADLPVVGGGPSFRLGDVYAEELERLLAEAAGPEGELPA